jgi:hypothetical protein
VFVFLRHAKARRRRSTAGRRRVQFLLLGWGRLERGGWSVQAVLRSRIEFGNLGIRLRKFLFQPAKEERKRDKNNRNSPLASRGVMGNCYQSGHQLVLPSQERKKSNKRKPNNNHRWQHAKKGPIFTLFLSIV